MASFLEKQGFKNARNKKRRHSYTSARSFATRTPATLPLTPTHSLTGFQRAGSLTGSYRSSASSEPEDGPQSSSNSNKKSFSKFLRSIKKKRSQSQTSQLTSSMAASNRSDREPELDCLAGQRGEFVRVVSTVLNPKIYYKTLPITKYTTVFEVVVKLVGKYANLDDQNPSDFYLTEVKESEQGSYSRLLENSDRIYDIQIRWEKGSKCSFTLCRKDALSIEDDVFLKNPVQAMVMSPSHDFCDNGFTGVVDVDVPTTPTSPNSYNAQTSFFDSFFPPPKSSLDPFLLSVSPSELSADEIIQTVKQNSRIRTAGIVAETNSNNHNNMGPQSAVDVSTLMQQSVDKGMLGIMNKIVTEEKQGTSTVSESPRRLAGEEVVLRPLICSPMVSEAKKFPEFIFTPKPTSTKTDEANSSALELVVSSLNFEEVNIDSTHSITTSPPMICRATHSLFAVKFASTCVVYPRFHCSASFIPSSSRNAPKTTARDMTDLLYDMLDNQSSYPSEENVFQLSPPPLNKNSFDEHTNSKLTLKRYHTFHVRRDHLELHVQGGDNQTEPFHDQKIERAALALRQRHSTSSLHLSGGASLPKLARTESNSTTISHCSTLSTGHELTTDLDEMHTLKIRSRQNSQGSERSLVTSPPINIYHDRTDSDGIFEVKTRGRHRFSSFGTAQSYSYDSPHFRNQFRKASASNLTTNFSAKENADAVCSSDDNEVLFTFQQNYRPVTVLVQSKSASNIQEGTVHRSPQKRMSSEPTF